MPATYTLGKNYTVAGLTGVTDLTYTVSGERIDVTTRCADRPIKQTDTGLEDVTFEGTVLATSSTVFEIGKEYTVTLNGDSLGALVCMTANREESQAGIVTFKVTLKFGEASEGDNILPIGPGSYRS